MRATKRYAEGLDFSLHMSVTDWNVAEIPAMIDLANELGAKVLNFFFLVRTGRGQNLTDITAEQYEQILTALPGRKAWAALRRVLPQTSPGTKIRGVCP